MAWPSIALLSKGTETDGHCGDGHRSAKAKIGMAWTGTALERISTEELVHAQER
nr:hypothetical protein [Clostridia bacterium]